MKRILLPFIALALACCAQAAVMRPADFDAFWDAAVAKLDRETLLDLKMEREEARCTPGYDYYRINFASAAGRRLWGFLTIPTDKAKAPYPVHVQVPGAGPYHDHWWGASDHEITLMVNVLDFDPNGSDGMQGGYEAMCARLKEKYGFTGPYGQAGFAASREEVFYYPVILGLNRIVNWVCARPDVDHGKVSVLGGSQGGFMSLTLMALNPNITRGVAYVPAMGDLLAEEEGRTSCWPKVLTGYPKEKWPAIREIAPYFDSVNFAVRIKTKFRGLRGLADPTCPPTATKAIYDAITTPDKIVTEVSGMTHKVHPELEKELEEWVRR